LEGAVPQVHVLHEALAEAAAVLVHVGALRRGVDHAPNLRALAIAVARAVVDQVVVRVVAAPPPLARDASRVRGGAQGQEAREEEAPHGAQVPVGLFLGQVRRKRSASFVRDRSSE